MSPRLSGRLRLHPASRSAAAIHVAARRTGSQLALDYRVEGGGIHLPPAQSPRRADRLWETTCFEAFLRAPGCASYVELNFAPSTLWSAYAFDSWREGMRKAGVAPLSIERAETPSGFVLAVSIDLGSLEELGDATEWEIGLSAILEEADGARSFWALDHPEGPPDFHHRHCFARRLAAAAEA